MALYRVGNLPQQATSAAAIFHAEKLPDVLAAIAGKPDHLALLFEPADHSHRGWRLAMIQNLAREYPPVRVNGLEGDDEAAIAATLAYLAQAPGVTGQMLPIDGKGAG